MVSRSSNLPKRNEQLNQMVSDLHAANQGELVEARSLRRNQSRLGVKIKELGEEGPATKIHLMHQEELAGYLSAIMKTQRSIQRIELYKSSDLSDTAVLEKKAKYRLMPLSRNVTESIERTSDKLAIEFAKSRTAAVDLDVEGNLYIYEYQAQPSIKNVEEDKDVKKKDTKKKEKALNPLIRIHYLLR